MPARSVAGPQIVFSHGRASDDRSLFENEHSITVFREIRGAGETVVAGPHDYHIVGCHPS